MHTNVRAASIRFGRFELDHAAGELYRDGHRVRLQEHPRQVLVALLERPGELVTRDTLRERLWKSNTFVDFEHGLNTAVKKARQALGDSAETPQFIETVAKRGYRFIGEVETCPTAPEMTIDPAPPISAQVPSVRLAASWSRQVLLWAALVMLAAAGTASWSVRDRSNSLAVMPLRVLSQDRNDSDYLGIGIADTITTRLANTREIAVRPTSAVMPYKDAQFDPAAIAKSLDVRQLLLGTVQTTDDSYRISLQLVQSDGVVVWGKVFDEPAMALLQLQDRIADEVAAALRLRLSAPERQQLHEHDTANPLAYDNYLHGRALLLNYSDETRMRQAIKYFEDAVSLDANYTLARVGIATGCAWFSVRYAHEPEAFNWGRRADTEARAALAKDASLADAQLAVANAAGTAYGGFNWSIVLDRTAEALASNPSLDLAHLARMRAYYHLGLFDRAREEGHLALQVNPSANVEYLRLDVALDLVDGEYRRAVDKANALAKRVDMPAVPQYLGLALFYVGDGGQARETLGAIRRGATTDMRAQASLASVEAAVGMHSEARTRIAAVESGPDMDHHIAYSLGAAMAQLGDATASIIWLERAADTGFPCYPWFAKDPLLDPIRREPGFVRLMDRLQVAYQAALRRTS